MPTIKDVAQAAGVSIATVSYALNNRIDMISDETLHHVVKTAQQLGYTPNITARNLKASRTRLIGYAWPHMPTEEPNWVLDQFMYFLAHTAEAVGYHLLTFTFPQDDPVPVYDDLIRSGRLDAFVLTETVMDDPRIPFLLDREFPFVSFGRTTIADDFYWLDTDGKNGMAQAVAHLVELGHERIAMFGWPESSLTGNFRMQGYLHGMRAAGLAIHDSLMIRSDYLGDDVSRAFDHWSRLPQQEQPTAVVAISDFVAISVMREAERRGFRIGETLSVVGFDDVPFGKYLKPTLTTLRQPIMEITRVITSTLRVLLENENVSLEQRLYSPHLIVRDSSGPPR